MFKELLLWLLPQQLLLFLLLQQQLLAQQLLLLLQRLVGQRQPCPQGESTTRSQTCSVVTDTVLAKTMCLCQTHSGCRCKRLQGPDPDGTPELGLMRTNKARPTVMISVSAA